jgi:phage terminase large subunit-like protein
MSPINPRLAAALVERRLRRARRCPNEFIAFAFRDPSGRPLLPGRVHRQLQEFLTVHSRALIALPRDHGKSTQVCARVVWELGSKPGLRIVIVCASDSLAIERGRFLRDALQTNPRVRAVFPHLKPRQPWAAEQFTVERPAETIGPSLTALGIGSIATGLRADLLVCDDVVDVAAVHSRAIRERVKATFLNNLMNLLEPDGRVWCLFTPWHGDDLNAGLARNPAFAMFRQAVGPNFEPVWPEHWPSERLRQRRAEVGAAAFARGYRLLTATDEEVLIRRAWVQFWDQPHERVMTVLAIDPAISPRSTADASALVTLARTAANQVHCLEATAHRVTAPELFRAISAADARWSPDLILFESNAAFEGLRQFLAAQPGVGPKVKPVVQTRAKVMRFQAFAVAVENGTFRLRGSGGRVHDEQRALFDEITMVPFAEHDDLIDAAAMGTAYLIGPPEPRIL